MLLVSVQPSSTNKKALAEYSLEIPKTAVPNGEKVPLKGPFKSDETKITR
jgi:hypothetical protein